jgi:hypothetical protein
MVLTEWDGNADGSFNLDNTNLGGLINSNESRIVCLTSRSVNKFYYTFRQLT